MHIRISNGQVHVRLMKSEEKALVKAREILDALAIHDLPGGLAGARAIRTVLANTIWQRPLLEPDDRDISVEQESEQELLIEEYQ